MFNPMSFFLFKLLFEDSGLHRDSNSQSGSPLGSVWAQSFTLFHTLKNVNVTLKLHSRPVPFHALVLVASLRLGS
jgi:hypothetical protein